MIFELCSTREIREDYPVGHPETRAMKTKLFPVLITLALASVAQGQEILTPSEAKASAGVPSLTRSRWIVHKTSSPIDDSQSVSMMLFPTKSEEARGAYIKIRWVEKKLEVYASCGGYIGSDSPKVTIRWDSEPAKDEVWSPSATGDAAFARYSGEFVQRAMKSAKVVIRIHEFRAPATAIFDLSGLTEELEKLPALKLAVATAAKKNAADNEAWKRKIEKEVAEISAWQEQQKRWMKANGIKPRP